MKNKQVFTWFLDLIIMIIILVEYSLNLTGLKWHEWLGLGVGALLLVHFMMHWQWVVAVSKRLASSISGKTAMYYAIDCILLALFTSIILTGLAISSLLNLPLLNYQFWHFLHVTVSYLTLVVVGLKFALHWNWIANTATRKIFLRNRGIAQPVGTATSDSAILNRRQFLAQTGIFTGALVCTGIGYGKWMAENLLVEPVQQSTVDVQVETGAEQSTATAFQPRTEASVVQTVTSVSTNEPTSVILQSTVTSVPTVQAVKSVAAKSVPTCNRNCSYPGHCHRYVDSNNNNRCDHSESI
jgi:hypothetical protein